MLFGSSVVQAVDAAPAGWIAEACRGAGWTVGALVPNDYPKILRIAAPDAEVNDWWSAYRDLYAAIAAVGVRHTTRPDVAWFGVWEGHGFGHSITRFAWREPVDDATRRAFEERREVLRVESERRNPAIRAALADVPAFELPGRRYYLLSGPVMAVSLLRYPDQVDVFRNPDLFWPDDRTWFVATDVDFWSVYVGGDDALITELAEAVPTESELVDLDRQLPIED